jgi:glutathione S-transferase
MKYYDSFGMNPRIVRFFMLEKGVELPREEVDIFAMENRREPYLSRNPSGQTPLLELEDGTCLAETAAICEYLEEQYPSPPLIGSNAQERAITRMWWRRAEINVCLPMVWGFYFAEGLDIFRERTHCAPEAAEGMKERARKGMRWMDGLIEDGKWLAGDRFTAADICLYCYMDALKDVNQPVPEGCSHLEAWFTRVGLRPAAAESLSQKLEFGLAG